VIGRADSTLRLTITIRAYLIFCFSSLSVAGCKQGTDSRHEHKTVQVNWREELNKTQDQLQRNPNSAFLHNQAAVAYDALGDFEGFDREIHTAMTLDSENTIDYYVAYAVYKRRHLRDKSVFVLNEALKIDQTNPLGHYEKAAIFEGDKQWQNALEEYLATRELVREVKSHPTNFQYGEWRYLDARGNPYDVTDIASLVDSDIIRVRKDIQKSQ
jgi:tetratricopeptide (TPR) repeat protein